MLSSYMLSNLDKMFQGVDKPTVVQLPSSQVQQNFGAAVERALRGEDVVIERYGMPRAAVVE